MRADKTEIWNYLRSGRIEVDFERVESAEEGREIIYGLIVVTQRLIARKNGVGKDVPAYLSDYYDITRDVVHKLFDEVKDE